MRISPFTSSKPLGRSTDNGTKRDEVHEINACYSSNYSTFPDVPDFDEWCKWRWESWGFLSYCKDTEFFWNFQIYLAFYPLIRTFDLQSKQKFPFCFVFCSLIRTFAGNETNYNTTGDMDRTARCVVATIVYSSELWWDRRCIIKPYHTAITGRTGLYVVCNMERALSLWRLWVPDF